MTFAIKFTKNYKKKFIILKLYLLEYNITLIKSGSLDLSPVIYDIPLAGKQMRDHTWPVAGCQYQMGLWPVVACFVFVNCWGNRFHYDKLLNCYITLQSREYT